jgi:hypothetical protein
MKNNELIEFGEILRKSNVTTITVGDLLTLLRRKTNVFGMEQLKNYIKILRDDKYIRFTPDGLWEVIREEKKPIVIDEKDIPLKTVEKLDEKIQEFKEAKIVYPMNEKRKVVSEKDEQKYKQQIKYVLDKLEKESKQKKKEAMTKNGIYIIWIDSFEYVLICHSCFEGVPKAARYVKGRTPIEEILSNNVIKNCEYCGRLFSETIDEQKV